jgi:glycosyltransferase involved in cell wall biosynthesis
MRKIIALNTGNIGGGAEKVAYALAKALHLRGYDSLFMARRVDLDADALARTIIRQIPESRLLYSAGNFLDDIFSTQYIFYLPTWKLALTGGLMEADVIHMHNMHGNYFNLLTIPFLMWQKPVVWTFHDMWPFTGKCVHSFDCNRFMESCGSCPQIAAYPRLSRDTSSNLLALKKAILSHRKFVIVSPSEWLKSRIEKSILHQHPVVVIPSPIDTTIFYPEEKRNARQRLGIPQEKKVLLFVASWVNSIPSKGINIFKEMLHALSLQRGDLYTVIIGHLEEQSVLENGIMGKETGWISDPDVLRGYYSAADVFISPTLAENSSCTIAEAMGCGTSVVAFATGGVPEQVRDGLTGLLVEPNDVHQLIDAVRSVLSDDERRAGFGASASKLARERFSMSMFVDRHLSVYDQAIRYHSA